MRRPRQGNQLLAQHLGRAGEQKEKLPPTRSQAQAGKSAAGAAPGPRGGQEGKTASFLRLVLTKTSGTFIHRTQGSTR